MNTLFRIILVALVVGGIYFFAYDKNPTLTPSPLSQNEAGEATQNDDTSPLTPSAEGDDSVIVNEDQGGLGKETLSKDVSLPLENATWTISYSNAGFYPTRLTIKKGDTVRFVNNSDDDLWVTSTSDLNSKKLDSSRALGSGEVFTYTFSTPGSWNYFNQTHTSSTGTIEVK